MKDFKCQKIIFQNIEYPIRQVNLPKFGKVSVSIDALNEKVINKNNGYVSKEAAYIDEQIFFFISEDYIYKSKTELQHELIKQIL